MSFKTTVTRTFGRQTLKLKQNSPHILFAGGLAGVVASTVMACKATLSLESVVDNAKAEFDEIKESVDKGHTDRKDLAYVYVKNTFLISEVYAPAVAVGGVSLLALTGAHIQLSRRNAALTIAYTGLHRTYNDYRNRVRNSIGEVKERDQYFGTTTEEIEDDKGKKREVKTVDVNKVSAYARFFDEGSANWHKDPELNRLFVQCQQNYANHLLQARGHVFLNEVYDMLGIDRSSAGQVVGWVINDKGDNFVDFGMFEAHNSRFVNGYERSILLDFNVDGVVYDKI